MYNNVQYNIDCHKKLLKSFIEETDSPISLHKWQNKHTPYGSQVYKTLAPGTISQAHTHSLINLKLRGNYIFINMGEWSKLTKSSIIVDHVLRTISNDQVWCITTQWPKLTMSNFSHNPIHVIILFNAINLFYVISSLPC